jgi:hypothetical protein
MSDRIDSIPDMPVRPVVICDPLHLFVIDDLDIYGVQKVLTPPADLHTPLEPDRACSLIP